MRACPACGSPPARRVMRVEEMTLRQRRRVEWDLARCAGCGLVYVATRHGEGPARSAYEGEDYGFVRSAQADAFVDGRPHAVRVLEELESEAPPGRLLDVGCATGEFLLAARERGWKVAGIEVSPHASALARERGLEVSSGTLEDAGLATESFDAVTMLDVIEHLDDPMPVLAEVRRILRPGGVLCLETPNWDSVYRRLLGRRWAALQPRLHLLYFDPESIRRTLQRAGFETARVATEIVALLSPEGRLRGFGPSTVRSMARDTIVRLLLRSQVRALDQALVSVGPGARGRRPDSFKAAHERAAPAASGGPPSANPILKRINAPLDRVLLDRDMGEQLRVYARRR